MRLTNDFKGKKQLVAQLCDVYKTCTDDIADIKLKKYIHNTKGWTQEFVLLTWVNGGISTANNNMNSLAATARNVAGMIDGGVYENLDLYKEIMKSKDWTEVL